MSRARFLSGCTAAHYHRSADKETYRIVQHYEQKIFGHTNAFTIDSPYSARKPELSTGGLPSAALWVTTNVGSPKAARMMSGAKEPILSQWWMPMGCVR